MLSQMMQLYLKDVTFVFEHTPELIPSDAYVYEGYKWVSHLVTA